MASPAALPAQRTALLGSEATDAETLGPLLDPSFEATATEHFVLLHDSDAPYVEGACQTLECAYTRFYEAFARAGFHLARARDRLVWICFPHKRSFSKYALQVEGMDLSWLDGYYSTLTNRVAVVESDQETRPREDVPGPTPRSAPVTIAAHRAPREGILAMSTVGQRFDVTRLTHELAHQLAFNSGIQKRGVMYPLWVSEGLATNFEFDGSATAGLDHHCNMARCRGLLEAYTAGELVPLRQFVVQTTVPPDARVGRRYYAQAWGFFQFILTERSENLRHYLHQLADDHPERHDRGTLLAEFTRAFGAPETLEPAWNAFLTRQAQALSAGCSAPVRTSAPGTPR